MLADYIKSGQEAKDQMTQETRGLTGKDGKIIKILKKYLEESGEEYKEDGYYHPSGLSNCVRILFYNKLSKEKKEKLYKDFSFQVGKRDARSQAVLDTGTQLHIMVQYWLIYAGIIDPANVEITITDNTNKIKGTLDGLVEIEGKNYVLEFKTCNYRTFSGELPLKQHVEQAQLYMHLVKNVLKKPVNDAIILYLNKDDSQMREFSLPYNENLIKYILGKKDYIEQCLEKEKLPLLEKTACPDTNWKSYCPFKKVCNEIYKTKGK